MQDGGRVSGGEGWAAAGMEGRPVLKRASRGPREPRTRSIQIQAQDLAVIGFGPGEESVSLSLSLALPSADCPGAVNGETDGQWPDGLIVLPWSHLPCLPACLACLAAFAQAFP